MVLASLVVAVIAVVAVPGLFGLRPLCASSEARPPLVDGRFSLGEGCVVGRGTSKLVSPEGLRNSRLAELDGLVGGDGGACPTEGVASSSPWAAVGCCHWKVPEAGSRSLEFDRCIIFPRGRLNFE